MILPLIIAAVAIAAAWFARLIRDELADRNQYGISLALDRSDYVRRLHPGPDQRLLGQQGCVVMSGVQRHATRLGPRNFWERLLWSLLVCRECNGTGEFVERDGPWRHPGAFPPYAALPYAIKRKPCPLCRGNGRLWRA